MIICIPCHLCKKKSRSEKGTTMFLFLLLDTCVYQSRFSLSPYCRNLRNYKFCLLSQPTRLIIYMVRSNRLGKNELFKSCLVLGTSDLFDRLFKLFPLLCAWLTVPIKDIGLFFLRKFLMNRIITDDQIWFLSK